MMYKMPSNFSHNYYCLANIQDKMPGKKSALKSAPKEKPKKSKKSKEDMAALEEINREMEATHLSSKPSKKRVVEFEPEEPITDEEGEEIVHICGECQEEFLCADGKFSKDGKRFKCSCPREKDGSDVYYFCSENCLQGPDETAQSQDGAESPGYEDV